MGFNYDYVKESLLEGSKKHCERSYLSERVLGITEVNNGIILPGRLHLGGGVLDDAQYYDHSFLHNEHPWGKAYAYDPEQLVESDEDVIYLGMFCNVWGHCITDCLSQLWPLLSDNVPEQVRNAKWVYTTLNGAPLPANFERLLGKLGISLEDMEQITTPTRFGKIYLPDSSFFIDKEEGCRKYTQEFLNTINKIMEDVAPDCSASKIYFTRTAIKDRKDFGEKTVEDVFRKLGYRIVSPEKHTLDEQLAMLKGCRSFASTEGSCSHNGVFLSPGSEIQIIRKADYFNGYQYPINSMKGLNVTYIDANKSNLHVLGIPNRGGPFYMCVTKELAAFAGTKRRFSVKEYCKYFCVVAIRNMLEIAHRALGKLKSLLKG